HWAGVPGIARRLVAAAAVPLAEPARDSGSVGVGLAAAADDRVAGRDELAHRLVLQRLFEGVGHRVDRYLRLSVADRVEGVVRVGGEGGGGELRRVADEPRRPGAVGRTGLAGERTAVRAAHT